MIPFRRKRDREPTPSWIKWLLIGFAIMAVIGNLRPNSKVHESFQNASHALNPKNLLHTEDIKSKMFPTSATLRAEDVDPGQGEPAVCGQQVNITFDTFADDKALTGKNTSLAFRIGDHSVAPALEQGVIGMKPRGRRNLFAPASMASGLKLPPSTISVRFEVWLTSATPYLPDAAASHYRIISGSAATGPAIACGETAHVHVTLWSVDGKKLFSTKDQKPLDLTPGKSEVFLGLEQGVIGMPAGGTRTLIVPPAFQKTMNGNAPATDFPFPKNQTVLVDVEGVP
ncbi:MAG: FKBP-type peptidyl-prolyl cis-trans isomerase [Pseudomonadota bacterium]|nr:FKBP-type peptidyl-prolyl cis-trans isomerase [Pseudomonadota bacterium]